MEGGKEERMTQVDSFGTQLSDLSSFLSQMQALPLI